MLDDVIALLAAYFCNRASLGLLEPWDGKLRLCCTLWYPQTLSSASGRCLALIPVSNGSQLHPDQVSPCRLMIFRCSRNL